MTRGDLCELERVRLTGVILAGGASRRMGRDKAQILVGSKRLVDIVFKRLARQCDRICISSSVNYGLPCETIEDDPSGPLGPVGGVFSAFQNLGRDVDGILTVPVDCPVFPDDLAKGLVSFEASTIAADDEGLHPTFAWWRRGDLEAAWKVLGFSKSISLRDLSEVCGARAVVWPGASRFININTPEELGAFCGAR